MMEKFTSHGPVLLYQYGSANIGIGKSTTTFLLMKSAFTCRPNHDVGPIFYLSTDEKPTRRF